MATEANHELLVNAKTVLGSSTAVPTTPGASVTGLTTTNVRQPTQTVNTILKAANPDRYGLSIFNNSTANLFIKLGASAAIGAGVESFTKRLAQNQSWKVPFGYTGRVDAIWDAVDATGEALLFEQFGGLSPFLVTGLQAWLRADQGVTNPGGGCPAWTDHSGMNRNLVQATAARQFTHTASIINGQPAMVPGIAADDRFMSFTAWTAPSKPSIYAVVRFRTSVNYQIFMYAPGTNLSGMYFGGQAPDPENKPFVYTNAPVAAQPTALTNLTNYLLKWAWDDTTETAYTRVNNSAQVSAISGVGFTSGTFNTLGFDPALVNSQDIFSDIGEIIIYDHLLSAAEETLLWSYINARYAIF